MNTENKENKEFNKNSPPQSGVLSGKTPIANEASSADKTPQQTSTETLQTVKGPRKSSARRKETTPSEFVEQVVAINRVTKVTKGGKKLSFSALVVVGDMKGRVGYSLSKANEVAIAIKKALISAKKNMITVPLYGLTIPHQVNGICGAALVMLKPAAPGTGVIAAGPVRAVCDSAGIRNILTKCHRSNNPINVVKATVDGLSRLKPRTIQEGPGNGSEVSGGKDNVSA